MLVLLTTAAPTFLIPAPLGQYFRFGTLNAIEDFEHDTPVEKMKEKMEAKRSAL